MGSGAAILSHFSPVDDSTLAIMKNDAESMQYMMDSLVKSGLLGMGAPNDEDENDPEVQKKVQDMVQGIARNIFQDENTKNLGFNETGLMALGANTLKEASPSNGGGIITKSLIPVYKPGYPPTLGQ
jgi:hypothetical protein